MQSRRAQRSSFFTTTARVAYTPVGPVTFDEWKDRTELGFSYNGGPGLSTGLQHPSLTTNFAEIIVEINAARDIPMLEAKARELDELIRIART